MNDAVTRRDLLAGFLGLPAALAAGCARDVAALPPAGEIVGTSDGIGHRLRDGFRPVPAEDRWEHVGVVIVGGGIAGLSAAWRLLRAGFQDFVVLELEPQPGGTSRSATSDVVPYPWGAHYIPAPLKENQPLVSLLDEMGVLEGQDANGEAIVAEQFLCRDPQERVYYRGQWYEGLYLYAGASQKDLAELKSFRAAVDHWVAWRDAGGRRAFTIPVAAGSDDADVTELDKISMAAWLDRQGFSSPRLRWLVDYSCRDDYGMTLEQTSAWAGLFYFAARVRKPGEEAQPLITWPEGNGRFVEHLYGMAKSKVRLGRAVSEVIPTNRGGRATVDVVAVGHSGEPIVGLHADQVIFAAPHFLAPYLIRSYRDDERRRRDAAAFQYGAWMVANLFLKDRPRQKRGFPLAWDNVLYESPSLGYVAATHQRGIDYGPTVLTYYYALCDDDPGTARRQLLSLDWRDWADVVLTDLGSVHRDIRSLVERLDVVRWGHAMIRPQPGFVWGGARTAAARPFRSIHFAHSDLSGLALFEEAFYQGNRAAEEVLAARRPPQSPEKRV